MMPGFLRQATASQSRAIGPFLDDADFKTAETGLTIANTDIKLMANGGASANKNSGGGTHRVNGFYGVTFDATDTATVGELAVSVVVAGALPVFDTFTVMEEAAYDMLFGAAALGYVANAPVNVAQWSGTNVATPDTAGHPKVTIKNGTGTGELSLSSGRAKIQGAYQINTAVANFPFQMTDETTHNPLAGLGDAAVDVSYSHDGGESFTSLGFAAEGTGGAYYKTLTSTAMNAASVMLKFTATGADTLSLNINTTP